VQIMCYHRRLEVTHYLLEMHGCKNEFTLADLKHWSNSNLPFSLYIAKRHQNRPKNTMWLGYVFKIIHNVYFVFHMSTKSPPSKQHQPKNAYISIAQSINYENNKHLFMVFRHTNQSFILKHNRSYQNELSKSHANLFCVG